MGRPRNYESGLYNEFEKLNQKLDKANNTISTMSLTIYNLQLEIKKYQEELKRINELNAKLIEENERLKNHNNKNSNNSSKPSSTNQVTPKKKTGANLYNYRIQTEKKVGGQVGHNPHNLNKKEIEKMIEENKLKVKTIYHKIKGNEKKAPLVKYRMELEVNTYVEKHIFEYDEKAKEILPKEFYTDVTYGTSIKSLAVHLSCYNVIAYDRLSNFFEVITNNILKISNGTLVNFVKEFGRKSEKTIEKIEESFLNGVIGYTDETGTKFNNKNIYIRNYSNEENVVYKVHRHKGHQPIKEDNILPRFCGGIMGDHDTTLYSYGSKNYECNIHLGRYLMELMENIPDTKWPFLMYEFMFRMNNTRKIAMAYGLNEFDKEKIKEYEQEYDKILELAKEETKNIKSNYYRIHKAKPLYNRLIKYKENHLYFMKDFQVPFDDNLSERDLRIFKNKTKISGGFRSLEVAQYFANALSIIKTSIKRNRNPYDSIKDIFNNKILFN